ncbi:MAG: UDP-N-acetylmuramoyl-L-alanyl-D-glutamate--2,6-diaminopimelate ligase, partial [Bacteroidales bacterium]|nr:UDP-N-acetylmuramoyl-L-alanyl-D-glutamate--2,6-diaminopimelate ligase [Bacteroidales bacterium]
MKKLSEILKGIAYNATNFRDVEVGKITFDSRAVEAGTMFVAQVGVHVDGHKFIDSAISKGAAVVLCQTLPENLNADVVYIQTVDSSKALGIAASNFFDNPSQCLKLIGITGTNGKTTTVTLLHRMFRELGFSVGLLSTVVNKIDEQEIPSTHTTPD